jgi:hypothetical protein
VALGDIGDGQIQRTVDGKRFEIIANSIPRFSSPMDLFDKFSLPIEEQVKFLRENPKLREIEEFILRQLQGWECGLHVAPSERRFIMGLLIKFTFSID